MALSACPHSSWNPQDTVGAAEAHARKHGIDPRDLFLWVDEFSLRFPVCSTEEMEQGKGEDYITIFRNNIARCNWTLAVFTPWDDPAWTKRIWCVDEGYETVVAGARLSLGLPPQEEERFLEALRNGAADVITKLSVFDIRNATVRQSLASCCRCRCFFFFFFFFFFLLSSSSSSSSLW